MLHADFDELREGGPTTVLADGGVTFSELDQRLGSFPDRFVVEDASDLGSAELSTPNLLGFGSYGAGSAFAFGRFGSARITFAAPAASEVVMDVFSFRSDDGNVLRLLALRAGLEVGASEVSFEAGSGVLRQTLSISGVVFEELRLVAQGAAQDGTVFVGIDNVHIKTHEVPVPSTSSLVALAFAAIVLGTHRARKDHRSEGDPRRYSALGLAEGLRTSRAEQCRRTLGEDERQSQRVGQQDGSW